MKQEDYSVDDTESKAPSKTVTGMGERPLAAYVGEHQTGASESVDPDGHMRSPGLLDGVKIAWRHRLLLTIPIVLACLASLALLLFSTFSSPTQIYQYPFQFTFSGSEEREYPNGEVFNLQDIIAPNVINAVYQKTLSNQTDVGLTEFQAGFTITAYSPARDFILKKYKSKLSARGLTFAETNQLQNELEAELRSATRRSAVISYDNSETNLADETLKTTMEQIVQEWSRYSTEKRGVQKLNLALMEGSFINEGSVSGSGSSGVLRSIIIIHGKVQEYISSLQSLQLGTDLRDSRTGQTFESLSTRLEFVAARIVETAKGMLTNTEDVSVGMGGMISSVSFDLFKIDNADPQIAFEVLLERLADVHSNIRNIKTVPFGDVVRDTESSLTVTDLANALEEIESFQIKPLRDKSLVDGLSDDRTTLHAFYKQRLAELQRQRNAVSSVVDAIELANSNYRTGTTGNTTESNGSARNSPPVAPQFDGGFLDRLITVTGESKDSEFRQGLVKRTLELQEEVAKLNSDVSVVEENLRNLKAGENAPQTASRKAEQDAHRKTINNILQRLKEQLDITVRISKRIALSQSLSEVLVQELGLEPNDRRIHPTTFLSNNSGPSPTVPDVLSELQGIIEIANRIKEDLAVAVYGTNSLFSPLAEPKKLTKPILDRQTIVMIALFIVLGMILSGFLFLVKLFRFQ